MLAYESMIKIWMKIAQDDYAGKNKKVMRKSDKTDTAHVY